MREEKDPGKLDKSRRKDFACPSCGKSPLVGEFWTCPHCSWLLDVFDRAACPKCGTLINDVQCTECHKRHASYDWSASGMAGEHEDKVVSITSAESIRRGAIDLNAAHYYRRALALMPRMTGAEMRIRQHALTTPLNEVAHRLIRRSEPALQELRQGAARELCAWELDSPKQLQGLIDLAVPVRRLCDLTCLRARQAFRDNEGGAALETLADLLVMARHYGRAGPLLVKVMQSTIELFATELAAAHLLEQDTAILQAFAARLASLPEPGTLAEMMEKEKQYLVHVIRPKFEGMSRQEAFALLRRGTSVSHLEAILKAAGPEPTGLLKLIDDLAGLYDELGSILMLPDDQVPQEVAKLAQQHEKTNPWIAGVVRQLSSVTGGRLRSAMLRAAVAIAAEGNWREAVRDPFRTGPFVCRCFKAGFELKANSGFPDQPLIVLTVGKKQGLFGRFLDFLKRLVG